MITIPAGGRTGLNPIPDPDGRWPMTTQFSLSSARRVTEPSSGPGTGEQVICVDDAFRHPDPPTVVRSEGLTVAESAPGHVVVTGDVDLATAPVLDAFLNRLSPRSGPVTVDLREVSCFAAAGVRVLFSHAQHGLRCWVVRGTAVAKVLDICGLERVVTVRSCPPVGRNWVPRRARTAVRTHAPDPSGCTR